MESIPASWSGFGVWGWRWVWLRVILQVVTGRQWKCTWKIFRISVTIQTAKVKRAILAFKPHSLNCLSRGWLCSTHICCLLHGLLKQPTLLGSEKVRTVCKHSLFAARFVCGCVTGCFRELFWEIQFLTHPGNFLKHWKWETNTNKICCQKKI